MKSMEKDKNKFSFQDFEKGLMLAGYLSPANAMEVNERKVLEEFDKKKAKENKEIYFKRIVLAAEIVNQLLDEFTFGRVKFQKLVYLCENACNMQLNQRYLKFAAGPFDSKFMHTVNPEFKKQKWFSVSYRTNGGFKVPVYKRLENFEKYKKYYESYYGDYHDSIQEIINIFRKQKTRHVELVATIYACILELKDNESNVSNEDLIEAIYGWNKAKEKFSKKEIIITYEWMISNKITPC